jgi:DNA-binding beta-propeller fold protein YncE
MRSSFALLGLFVACTPAAGPVPAPEPLAPIPIPLPGATASVDLDYLACDRAAGRVWVPAGGTGNVDVVDAATLAVTPVGGFPTQARSLGGFSFTLGPTAVALGDGVAYIGSRADASVCVIDARTLARGACFPLGATPDDLASSADGMAYVGSTRELWVTRGAPTLGLMPPASDIVVLDASSPSALAAKTKVVVPGAAEGYAVDDAHGVFYTNVVDKNLTVAIDVRAHAVRATWHPGCGDDGPRGIAVDSARGIVLVACTDHVVSLDASHDGAVLASAPIGQGIDNIDYVEGRRELYVAAGRAARLAVLRVADDGTLATVATAETARGARVVVADANGTAFVGDPKGGRLLAFHPAQK